MQISFSLSILEVRSALKMFNACTFEQKLKSKTFFDGAYCNFHNRNFVTSNDHRPSIVHIRGKFIPKLANRG